MKKALYYTILVILSVIVYALFQTELDKIIGLVGALTIIGFIFFGIAGLLLKGVREIFG